jgi:ABC-type transport system involved in multi-copper enzyme maturation permease subunit
MVEALEAGFYRIFRFNPCVAVHELRMRMRGWRPFVVLLAYAAVASSAAVLAWMPLALEQHRFGPRAMEIGRSTFVALAHTQLTLILLIVPAYAAGAVTMEREKRTLEMLRATLVTPSDIVTGKLFVILAFGLVLLITSVPVASWCILLGGVAPEEIFYVYSYLFSVAFFGAALGMLYSARMRRSMGAIVAAYGTLITISVLSFIIPMIIAEALLGGVSSNPTLGVEVAFWVVLAFSAVAAWMVFLIARAVAARVLARGRRWTPTGLGLAISLGLLAVAVLASGPLVRAVSRLSITAFVILNPYAALAALMEGDIASLVVHGAPGGGHAPTGLQFELWAVATAIFLLLAVALWGGATTAFSRRHE